MSDTVIGIPSTWLNPETQNEQNTLFLKWRQNKYCYYITIYIEIKKKNRNDNKNTVHRTLNIVWIRFVLVSDIEVYCVYLLKEYCLAQRISAVWVATSTYTDVPEEKLRTYYYKTSEWPSDKAGKMVTFKDWVWYTTYYHSRARIIMNQCACTYLPAFSWQACICWWCRVAKRVIVLRPPRCALKLPAILCPIGICKKR